MKPGTKVGDTAGEGCEVHGQRRSPQLTQMFNEVKGGNYHE